MTGGINMRIVNREEFLSLVDPVLYIKCDKWGNPEDELSVSYGRSSEGSNDFVSIGLHCFIKEWNGDKSLDYDESNDLLQKAMTDRDAHFEWDYTSTGRDGLYDEDQLFMVYEKLDLLKLLRELNKIYEHKYHKDDYRFKYQMY
jgi:hypothetical protein